MKLSPQCQQVMSHLTLRGSISGVEAQAIYRIRSLPRRILDIRKSGVLEAEGQHIEPETRRDPLGQRYTRYHLKELAAA